MNITKLIQEWRFPKNRPAYSRADFNGRYGWLISALEEAITTLKLIASPEGWDGGGRQHHAMEFLKTWTEGE